MHCIILVHLNIFFFMHYGLSIHMTRGDFILTSYICIQVPVDLVVDHSVQVDVARSENAVQANMEHEFRRNKERFAFLKWGSSAFHNMLVVPPGSGIVHQVRNLTFHIKNPTFTAWQVFSVVLLLIGSRC